MKRETIILLAVFAAALIFRLIFAFSTNLDYEAYYNLRQVEHITKTALPVIHDNLSYGGRTLIITPVFHYILAFFNIFLPLQFVAKLFPNIFAASLVFIIYFISKKLTGSMRISAITAAVSAFIPAFLKLTINTVSPYSLAIPLIFLAFYFIMDLNNRNSIYGFLALTFILPVTHPISLMFIIALLAYFLLVKLEHLKQPTQQLELILFATFAIAWIEFIIFKSALIAHGSAALLQNLPDAIKQAYFAQITISSSVLSIGLIPLIGGIYTIYTHLFKTKERNAYLFITFAALAAIMLWLRLLQPAVALSLMGIAFLPLLALAVSTISTEIKLSRFANYTVIFQIFLIALLVSTSFIPSFTSALNTAKHAPPDELETALLWLKNEEYGTALSTLQEGNMIASIARKPNVADTNFLLAKNPEQRAADISAIYTTASETSAISLLNKYNIMYILFTQSAAKEFRIAKPSYVADKKCFEKIYYADNLRIYKSLCKMQT